MITVGTIYLWNYRQKINNFGIQFLNMILLSNDHFVACVRFNSAPHSFPSGQLFISGHSLEGRKR